MKPKKFLVYGYSPDHRSGEEVIQFADDEHDAKRKAIRIAHEDGLPSVIFEEKSHHRLP